MMSNEVDESTEQAQEPEQKQEFSAEEIAKYKELRAEAANRRKENKELREKLEALEAEAENRQTAELAEQGKYKELAEQAEAKLQSLATIKKENEALAGALNGLLKQQREGLPESIGTLLDKLSPIEQLEWLTNYKAEATSPAEPEPEAEPTRPQQLTPFNPSGGESRENDAQRLTRLFRLTSGNSPFG